jgi:hypothetical protein
VGNWSGADMVQFVVLKLTDAARAFYNGSLELRESNVTWATFKATFQRRFWDVRTDQYHFTQLQMARQRKEMPQEFADTCRSLAHRTVSQVENPALQKLYHVQAERMLLASFTSGLIETPGRQVRFAMPKSVDWALKIAITVDQAELQERRNAAFYLRSQEAGFNSAARSHSRASRRDSGKTQTQHPAQIAHRGKVARDLEGTWGLAKTGGAMNVGA